MKYSFTLFAFWLCLLFAGCFTAKAHESDIVFKENKGQWHKNVLFCAEMNNNTLFIEKDGLTFVLKKADSEEAHSGHSHAYNDDGMRHAYKVHFKNKNTDCIPQGEGAFDDYSNYYIGSDTSRWAQNVRHFNAVVFKNLYPNIDLKIYSQNHILKYDLIVNPSGKIDHILFEYDGLDGMKLEKKSGNLVLTTSVGNITELAPYAYQFNGKIKQDIKSAYKLNCNRLQFSAENYNPSFPLIIDPLLIFSTYSGSTVDNWGYTATYDAKSCTYMAGVAFGNGYPTNIGAYQVNYAGGGTDVAIMKLSADGTTKLYATYLGGRYSEMPHSMIVNETNELVVFGTTGSDNFPTSATAYKRTFSGGDFLYYGGFQGFEFPIGSDIFVTKFSENGAFLTSTYVGGSKNDGLNYRIEYNYNSILKFGNDSLYNSYGDGARGEIITDDLSNIYIGSCTFSPDFPVTANAFQKIMSGRQEGVVFKLDYNLSTLIWSSFLGGSKDDAIYSVYTDSEYDLYVAGGTNSTNFPTTNNAFKRTYNGSSADGFVCKISYGGNQLINSSYIGSNAYDQCFFVRLDKDNLVYLLGQTKDKTSQFIKNANYKVTNGSQFICQLTPSLNQMEWSTVFGSGNPDFAPDLSLSAFGVDVCKRTYASGWGRWWYQKRDHGTSHLEYTNSAFQKTTDGQDFYLICLEARANGLNYASFFGEIDNRMDYGDDHVDGGTSRFDKKGTLYQSVCASCGGTQKFPITPDAYSITNNSSNCNNAVFRFSINEDFPVAYFQAPGSVCNTQTVNFTNLSRGTSYFWDFGDGQTSTANSPSHSYLQTGVFTVRLVASMPLSCHPNDTLEKQIIVMGGNNDTLNPVETCANLPTQIGLSPSIGMTYSWSPANKLSNPTVSNPYATIDANTLFSVIIFNGNCRDTLYQWVYIRTLPVDAGNNITTCSSPQILTATSSEPNVAYLWSSTSAFTDTLNINHSPSAKAYLDSSQYFYVKVTNINTCFGIDSLYIDFSNVANLSKKDPSCFESCDGQAAITLTAEAVPPVTYLWDDNSTQNNRTNLCRGHYSVLVKDNAGCSKEIKVPMIPPAPLSNMARITPQPCKKECTGAIKIQTTGGTPPYQYRWSTGETTDSLSNICEGTYILYTTDAHLCQKTDTFFVPTSADFILSVETFDNTCHDICTGKAIPTLSNADAPPYRFEWSNGSTDSIQNNLCAGQYSLTVFDADDCYATANIEISNHFTFENVEVWADATQIIESESTVLHATSIENVSYQWTPSENLLSPFDSVTTAFPPKTTTYHVQITDKQSCVYKDSVKVEVINIYCGSPDIKIPNTFTPNGDQNNDFFCIDWKWIEEYRFAIFNRWGEKVFETTNPSDCWDGKFRDKYCESGVYMYSLEATCTANKSYKTKGDITLIR